MKEVTVLNAPGKNKRDFFDSEQDWRERQYLRRIRVGNYATVQETPAVVKAIKDGKLLRMNSGYAPKPFVSKINFKVSMFNGARFGIFIPGEVISSKNSKRAFGQVNKDALGAIQYDKRGKEKVKTRVVKSEAAMQYEAETGSLYEQARTQFQELVKHLEKPYKIQFKFFRTTATKFDFANMVQIVQDMMVKNDWIEDDNMEEMLPLPDLQQPFIKRPEAPGVLISIFRM